VWGAARPVGVLPMCHASRTQYAVTRDHLITPK
jgi:hypothetical protein